MTISYIKGKFLCALSGISVFICIIALSSHPALCQTSIDIADWFILTPHSYWCYTGEGQPGSSVEDNFINTVLDEKINVGNGIMATRLEMATDGDDNGDQMFWYIDPDGSLFFCGFHNEKADRNDLGKFPAQDVILDDPLLMGKKGQIIGDEIADSEKAPVKIEVFGLETTIDAEVSSQVTYKEVIPQLETPLGVFTDVLRMIVKVSMKAQASLVTFSDDLFSAEFWLKQGAGMVLYVENSAGDKHLIIECGKVGGTDIRPVNWERYESLDTVILILQTLCGKYSQRVSKCIDINGDEKAGSAEAVYILERLSEQK